MMKKLLCTLIIAVISIGFVHAQAEINVQGNSIDIVDGDSSPDVADGTDFGQINVNSSSAEQLFTIQNTGVDPLAITLVITTNTSVFSVTTSPSGTVNPGESTTLGITFNAPSTAGVTSAEVFISHTGDTDENPYNFAITGEAVLSTTPEINVTGNGISIIGDGTNVTNTSDGTDFGSISSGNSSSEQIFVIQNQGGLPLDINAAFTTNPEFAVTTSPTSPVAPGGSTNIGITFNAGTAGVRTSSLIIVNNDSDETNYIINLSATSVAPPPDISVTGNGIFIIGDGSNTPNASDGTDFGQINVNTSSSEQLFVIANTGTSPLTLDSSPITTNPLFAITTTPSTTINPGETTTIGITFNAPATVGSINADLLIFSDDPDEDPYEINLTAEAITPSDPEINVTGNGVDIIGNGTNVPNVGDGTDFGQININTSSTEQIFIIQNTGTAPLDVNFAVTTNPVFVVTTSPTSSIPAGGSTTIGVTFNAPVTSGVVNASLVIGNSDDNEDPYQINLTAEAIDVVGPEIDVLDNANAALASGGSVDFGTLDVSTGSQTFTFTIENNGTSDLNLTDPSPFVVITGDIGDFALGTVPSSTITASNSTTFTITFDPTTTGSRNASVSIANNDSDENPYTFTLTGVGEDTNVGSPLLITQYYENGPNDFIEIKNISSSNVNPLFFVCVYEDLSTTTGVINSTAPNQSFEINTVLTPGEVLVINNLSFDGNDVILISTSDQNDSYGARIDIVGVVGSTTPPFWGANTSFIKGCGTNESPSLNFAYDAGSNTVTDYIELTTAEVDAAPSNTNLFLGTQTVGSTTYTSSWNNGIPDKTKNAIINGTYSGAAGSFSACDLTINASGNIDFSGSTSNFVKVENDLSINGSFTLGDNAALVTVSESASISGSIIKQESSTALNNSFDFTYWSSPVQGTTTSVFTNTGAPADRIFQWYKPFSGDSGGWEPKSGALEQARGYISEAPDGSTQHSISFTGTPYNGLVPITVGFDNTLPGGGGGFNLVGNPYPCAIDADTFISLSDNEEIDNGAFNGTLWFWTHNTAFQDNPGEDGDYVTDDYATYNLAGGTAASSGGPVPSGSIGSSQAFFVNAKSGGPIFFTNEMKLDGQNTQFFRGSDEKSNDEKDRMWLNATSKEGGAFNQILIGFFDNATDGEDRGYDGVKFSGGNYISLYSILDNKRMAIQGLGSYSSEKRINLGFDAWVKETFTIAIDKTEGILNTEEIYLVDNYLNVVHDLKISGYEFEITETGSFSDRFTLQFNKSVLGIDDEILNNNFIVVNENNTLRVRASDSVANIKVYDMLGRLLIDTNPNQVDFTLNTDNITKGTVLILNATLENGAEISKKAIKF